MCVCLHISVVVYVCWRLRVLCARSAHVVMVPGQASVREKASIVFVQKRERERHTSVCRKERKRERERGGESESESERKSGVVQMSFRSSAKFGSSLRAISASCAALVIPDRAVLGESPPFS